jgi:hypothetical protein
MAEDDVTFGFSKEKDEFLPSGSIFIVKKNGRMRFVEDIFQWRKGQIWYILSSVLGNGQCRRVDQEGP